MGIQAEEKGNNSITTSLYTWYSFLPKNLFEQFRRLANVFFLAVAVLQQIPGVSPTGRYTTVLPLGLVLLVTAVKAAIEDWRRHRADGATNASPTHVLTTPSTSRSAGGEESEDEEDVRAPRFVDTTWADLWVGDVVRVEEDETFPADMLLLASSRVEGTCDIETANLDGETNLKQRRALEETMEWNTPESLEEAVRDGVSVRYEPESPAIYSFSGNFALPSGDLLPVSPSQVLLRGCSLRNTPWIYGVVIYSGHDTKLMLNSAPRVSKISNVEKQTNFQIMLMFFVELSLSLLAAVFSGFWISNAKEDQTSYLMLSDVEPLQYGVMNFFTFFILFNNLIPISLYVSMELVKFGQAYLITTDVSMYHPETDTPAVALTSDLNEELGQVRYVFSDKTGTLTENVMEFSALSLGGAVYGSLPDDVSLTPMVSGMSSQVLPLSALQTLLRGKDVASPEWNAVLTMALANTVLPARRTTTSPPGSPGMVDTFSIRSPNASECGSMATGFNGSGVFPISGAQVSQADQIVYQASSPDEKALVSAARSMGCALLSRDASSMVVELTTGPVGSPLVLAQYELLHTLEFTSARKRMSVIVRDTAGRILLLTKGADAVIIPVLREDDRETPNYQSGIAHMEAFAESGLRTLMVAVRELDEDTYAAWRDDVFLPAVRSIEGRDERLAAAAAAIEVELTYIGVTAIEDKLQGGVAETISMLRKADMNVWVLTGDKQGTAINIAMSCSLITQEMELIIANEDTDDATRATLERHKADLDQAFADEEGERDVSFLASRTLSDSFARRSYAFVIDGATLALVLSGGQDMCELLLDIALRCRAVVVCRATPLQKSDVVRLVRGRESASSTALTLAIGDGSNDVSMIQSAHVGIGISGREGLQAAKAADYSIAQFRYLAPLLLKHGSRSYQRISILILWSFYKNILLYVIQLWFGVFNGFSGQSLFEKWSISTYNVFFTSLAILVYGLYNSEFSQEALLLFPELYNHKQFSTRIYWSWVAIALIQSLAVFFIAQAAVQNVAWHGDGHVGGLTSIGFVVYTGVVWVVNGKLFLETHSVSWLQGGAFAASIAAWYVFVVAYPFLGINSEAEGVGFFVLGAGLFWMTTLITIFITLLPDVIVMYVYRTFFPSSRHIVRELDARKRFAVGGR